MRLLFIWMFIFIVGNGFCQCDSFDFKQKKNAITIGYTFWTIPQLVPLQSTNKGVRGNIDQQFNYAIRRQLTKTGYVEAQYSSVSYEFKSKGMLPDSSTLIGYHSKTTGLCYWHNINLIGSMKIQTNLRLGIGAHYQFRGEESYFRKQISQWEHINYGIPLKSFGYNAGAELAIKYGKGVELGATYRYLKNHNKVSENSRVQFVPENRYDIFSPFLRVYF